MILVLFGQPHSGKSTIAYHLKSYFRSNEVSFEHIDGDKLRELFSNKDYSKQGRLSNLKTASDIAHYLSSNLDIVIVSLVYPYREAREYLSNLNSNVRWIYLHYDATDLRGRESFHVLDYDIPSDSDLVLNTSKETEEESVSKVIALITNNHE